MTIEIGVVVREGDLVGEVTIPRRAAARWVPRADWVKDPTSAPITGRTDPDSDCGASGWFSCHRMVMQAPTANNVIAPV